MKKISRLGVGKSKKKEGSASKGYTIGLDLGDKKSQYCVVDGAGEIVAEGSVRTSQEALEQQFKSYAGSVVEREAGRHSGRASRVMKKSGLQRGVANNRKVRVMALRRRKSDAEDAR